VWWFLCPSPEVPDIFSTPLKRNKTQIM
jgi:hypothetical protein